MLSICTDHWCVDIPQGTAPGLEYKAKIQGTAPGYWVIAAQVCANIPQVFQPFATEENTNCNDKCKAAEHHMSC